MALLVVVSHLHVGTLQPGVYAVFGFYIISGYLMTLIMHENYGYTREGRYAFAVNRFLRLYPQYWAAMLLSCTLLVLFAPRTLVIYNAKMYFPSNAHEWGSNVLLAFVAWNPNHVVPRLVPPTGH